MDNLKAKMEKTTLILLTGMVILIILVAGCINDKTQTDDKNEISKAQLKEHVRNILLRETHIGDPSKAELFLSYSKNKNVPINNISEILLEFAEDYWKQPFVDDGEGHINYLVGSFSIEVLGDLKYEEAVPLLKKIAKKKVMKISEERQFVQL